MLIDKLPAGKSKHYKWDNPTAKLTISYEGKDCKRVNVSYNKKPLLQHYCLGRKEFSLRLTGKDDIIVLSADRNNPVDSFVAVVKLEGQAISYTVQAVCKKKINDTIFIKLNKYDRK